MVKKVMFAIFCLLSWGTAYGETVSFRDDSGRMIVLGRPASRVVPLYGAFLEILSAIGASDVVVGRTKADEAIPAARELPSVGTHMKPNVEMILGLRPDLVVQSASRRSQLPEMDRLEEAGVPVAVFHPRNFEEIFSVMERLAVAVGRAEEGRRSVEGLRARMAEIRRRVRLVEGRKPRVFFEVRQEPLTAAGRGSIVQAILDAAGLENIVTVERPMVTFSVESLIALRPDYYIVQRGPMNPNPTPPANRPHFDQIEAVKAGRTIEVEEALFSRPGPRCVDALDLLVEAVYGGDGDGGRERRR